MEEMRRGFAAMDRERRREISSLGGRSIPAEKRAFSRDRQLASLAGRRGGLTRGVQRRAYPKCADCGKRTDAGPCPGCGKLVCQTCAEREGAFCCDGGEG